MYFALYRKYRPSNFDEVVGQEHITNVLKNEVATGRVAHSYLFTGSRGTGKTSCAKILAKAVNCTFPQDGNPCGECDNCKSFDNGTFLDVMEIDAASNSRIEDVRDLIDQAVYTPSVGKYRVYIIDEVHMLSNSAFNALLKIMEEPPAHIIFILATTEIHKVLATIISRCQRFDFRRIPAEIISNRLLEISKIENIDLTEDGATAISLLAEGGMRDAWSILEVCTAKRETITPEVVYSSSGILGYDCYIKLSDLLFSGDLSSALSLIDELLSSNGEASGICDGLLKHYRNLLLCKTIEDPIGLISCLPTYLPELHKQAKNYTLSGILSSLSILMELKSSISRSVTKRLELEIAMIKMVKLPTDSKDPSIISRIETLENRITSIIATGVAPSAQPNNAPVSSRQSPKPNASTTTSTQSTANVALPTTPISKAEPFKEWSKVLTNIKKLNAAIGGMLDGCSAFCDGKRVLIQIENPILLQMLKDNETTRNTIKRAIQEVTGISYGIGPYRPQVQKEESDPLDSFIGSLPVSSNIKIQ